MTRMSAPWNQENTVSTNPYTLKPGEYSKYQLHTEPFPFLQMHLKPILFGKLCHQRKTKNLKIGGPNRVADFSRATEIRFYLMVEWLFFAHRNAQLREHSVGHEKRNRLWAACASGRTNAVCRAGPTRSGTDAIGGAERRLRWNAEAAAEERQTGKPPETRATEDETQTKAERQSGTTHQAKNVAQKAQQYSALNIGCVVFAFASGQLQQRRFHPVACWRAGVLFWFLRKVLVKPITEMPEGRSKFKKWQGFEAFVENDERSKCQNSVERRISHLPLSHNTKNKSFGSWETENTFVTFPCTFLSFFFSSHIFVVCGTRIPVSRLHSWFFGGLKKFGVN